MGELRAAADCGLRMVGWTPHVYHRTTVILCLSRAVGVGGRVAVAGGGKGSMGWEVNSLVGVARL